MIKINKSASIPPFLAGQQAPATPDDVDACQYNDRDKQVKRQLLQDQHYKCCYCETHVDQHADIEHFRPVSAYTDSRGIKHTPGYYWLKISWDNLLLSCKCCNISFKRTHFGLIDERARDIDGKNILNEEPLLINPSTEDPGRFIRFRQHCAVEIACNGTAARGRYTINILRLNRSWLKWRRRKKWIDFCDAVLTLNIAKKMLAENPQNTDGIKLNNMTRNKIRTMQRNSEEYSGMINHQI